jgi:hypothetical protein
MVAQVFNLCRREAKLHGHFVVTPGDEEYRTAAPGCSFKEQAGRLLYISEKFSAVTPVAAFFLRFDGIIKKLPGSICHKAFIIFSIALAHLLNSEQKCLWYA